MATSGDGAGRYALGHSSDEVERLENQARIVDPITRRFWEAAGVVPGMRVLDVGCGAGHTTRLLAELVGGRGRVVGIDNAETAVSPPGNSPPGERTSATSTVTRRSTRWIRASTLSSAVTC